MGGNWRMPTFDEYKELCLNTDIYLVPTEGEEIQGTAREQSGIVIIEWVSPAEGTLKGVKFYKKNDSQTYMFIPAFGIVKNGSIQKIGEFDYLWTSSFYLPSAQHAWIFIFHAYYGTFEGNYRYFGVPVRGVLKASNKSKIRNIIKL